MQKNIFQFKGLTLVGLFIVFCFLFFNSQAQSNATQEINVTYCIDCVPFQFTNANGKADGPIIDYWRLWSQKTGIIVNFKAAPWNQTLESIRHNKVDAHAGLFYNDERNSYVDYGVPISKADSHVFYHNSIAFPDTLSELKAYRVGVLKDDFVDSWLQEKIGSNSVVQFEDYPDLISALNAGEIKLMAADTPTGLFHLGKAGLLANYKYEKLNPLYSNNFYVGVPKGDKRLLETINNGMNAISNNERLLISRTWATGQRSQNADATIIAIDSNYPPLSTIGIDGSPQGLMIDIWKEWAKVTGRKIEFKPSSWSETLNNLRTGEADIHFGLFKTEDRQQWLSFSTPFQSIQTGLFTKSDFADETTLQKLSGHSVGAIQGTYQAEFVKEKYPAIHFQEQNDRSEYILSLMRGEIDAIVEEVPTIEAGFARYGLNGAIKRQENLFENLVFAGVRKDNPSLLKVVNDGLSSIPIEKLEQIEARWFSNPSDRYFTRQNKDVGLTQQEIDWIKSNPVISIAATPDWPPFEWRDDAGKHKGILADFIKATAEKVGLKTTPVFGPWIELTDKLKNKEIDVAPGLNETPERKKYLFFTEAFTEYFSAIYTSKDHPPVVDIQALNGKTVVVEKGFAFAEIFARDYPEFKLVYVETTLQALQKLSTGEVDAYVGNQLVSNYLIQKYLLKNIKSAGYYNRTSGRFRFGIRNDLPLLQSILNKGLATISPKERNRIISTHTGIDLSASNHIALNDAERNWIAEHRTIRLGVDSAWPPFEYVDGSGQYSGLAAGYIQALSKRLDLEMIPQHHLTWGEAIKALENGSEVDMLPGVAVSEERKKFMNFTKPYLSFPTVLATQEKAKFISGLKDLKGKRVGVIEGYYTHHLLQTNHTDILIEPIASVETGLKALENGEIDAFFDNLAVITYEKDRLKLENIKIASATEYTIDLSMGVRKDWPELIPLLNKAIDNIDEKERTRIQNEWMAVRVNIGTDFETILMWGLPIIGGAVIIIAVISIWNRKMGHEIAERKKAQGELSDAMKHIEASINYASHIQKSILPDQDLFIKLFKEYFIFWEPRDVVGGDIYWAHKWGEGTVLCVGDCTGHGVPGAFMTLITTGAMDKALIETDEGNVSAFLNKVHQTVQSNLGQDKDNGASDDGMELGVCYFPTQTDKMIYSSARFDLFIVEDNEVSVIKPTKKGIGYRGIDFDQQYEQHEISIGNNKRFYMTSDGLNDQIGGERRRAFGKRRLKKLLLDVQGMEMTQQKEAIHQALLEHQGDETRRDDVSIFAFGF
ncbi:exported hypothetical protein [Candidatus Terasakiella magnetica]|uniref:Transporter substrate-binding domain-containing protein n=1 Tax=Candidatus Terasakiella magnetica TaxID=1867952 RepID=A0A1C3RH48_9PROT|nr:transporter substrate-binding domain-containing protein [Candidatus Terasakiella magnetica]SCA56568.1 exported hypothetical protein [Candidatus Terasakiella magnetica]